MNAARSIRTPFSPIRLLAVALALVAGFALAAVVAVPASAHVVLQGAEPPVDATVEAAPAQVIVLFSGEVSESGSTLTVTGPDGQPADTGDGGLDLSSLDRNRLIVTLLPNLPTGLYTVSYSATPADGHEAAVGSYNFHSEWRPASSRLRWRRLSEPRTRRRSLPRSRWAMPRRRAPTATGSAPRTCCWSPRRWRSCSAAVWRSSGRRGATESAFDPKWRRKRFRSGPEPCSPVRRWAVILFGGLISGDGPAYPCQLVTDRPTGWQVASPGNVRVRAGSRDDEMPGVARGQQKIRRGRRWSVR